MTVPSYYWMIVYLFGFDNVCPKIGQFITHFITHYGHVVT